MVAYSNFPDNNKMPKTVAYVANRSKDYRVYVNGEEIPVYTCRISKYPFNQPWPGYQRPVNQTDTVSYVNLVTDEEVKIEVEPLTKTAYKKIMVKPYSKGIKVEKVGGRVAFTLKTNGAYVFELDDYHDLLYIFNNKPVVCENPSEVTYYFDKGIHFAGKIVLKSNESLYVDKDALVYGCIYAEGADNVRVFGNGIFDDSSEERFSPHCSLPYIGNVKFFDCKNVKIEGVGFTNSATWCINLFQCFDVEIDGINVFGQWRYNTDGVDIVNCQRVTIKNSFIHSFDDTITIKGYFWDYDIDNTDMLFENCVLWCDWGRTCEIGLETGCRNYRNITFRNCDILRGGAVACDIQNGDCAFVQNITFEDIRLELESFYTAEQLQTEDEQVYSAHDRLGNALLVSISNWRYGGQLDTYFQEPSLKKKVDWDSPTFAAVSNITAKNLQIYCDEGVLTELKQETVKIRIENKIDTTQYSNITVENVTLNGKRLTKEDMEIYIEGNVEDLSIK